MIFQLNKISVTFVNTLLVPALFLNAMLQWSIRKMWSFLFYIPTKFTCEICQHESISTSALKGHISLNHDPTIPHTNKWNPNTCHICTFNFQLTFFNDTTLFKNHMIELHGFRDDSNECMQCESTQLGRYIPVGSQNILMECNNCQVLSDIENGLI